MEWNDMQSIWQQTPVKAPDMEAMLRKIHRFRRKQLIKTGAVLVMLCLFVIAIIWLFLHPAGMITTRIGEVFYLIAVAILFSKNWKSFFDLPAGKNYSNQQFLEYLKAEKKRVEFFFEKVQVFGFLIAAAGLLLYIYEPLSKYPEMIMRVYGLMAVFYLAGWFIVRPLSRKRQLTRLNEQIERLEQLSKQLNEK